MNYIRYILLGTAVVILAIGTFMIFGSKRRRTKNSGLWIVCVGAMVLMTFIGYSSFSITQEMIDEAVKNLIN